MYSLREQTLRHAYGLLQRGHRRQATTILARLLKQYPNDYHAWWLFANAVPNRKDGIFALENVLRLKPNHEKARQMLANLRASNIRVARAQAIAPDSTGELGRVEVRCRNCGALTAIEEGVVVDQCSFCGSAQLATQEGVDPRKAIIADYLLPFNISAGQCHEIAQQWLAKHWLTPSSIREWAKVGRFTPVFLPFWLVGCDVRGSWEYRDEDRVQQGKIYQNLRNLLQPSTAQLGDLLIEQMADYQLQHFDPYSIEKTAGVAVQLAEVKAYDSLSIMRQKMLAVMKRREPILGMPNTTIFPKYHNETWKPILVPVYLATYTYHGQVFKVIVNGQTGTISGQRPVDWIKVWGLMLIAILPALILLGYAIALQDRLVEMGLHWVIFYPAIAVLVVGMAACWYLLKEAFSYDNV